MQGTQGVHRDPQQLLDNVSDQIAALVRQEVADAINAITRRAPAAGKGLGLAAAGGLLLYVGFLAAVLAVVELLSRLMPRWLAAFFVSAGLAFGGLTFLQQGMERLNQAGVGPEQIAGLGEVVDDGRQWAERQGA